MVIPLRPGRFYGRSLPRPRIYTDIKLNSDRVDPPTPVLDPLMSWAEEAHWSMGGRCRTRLRLQGRIEGKIKKLKKQIEKREKSLSPIDFVEKKADLVDGNVLDEPPRGRLMGLKEKLSAGVVLDEPPWALVVGKKRKRVMTLLVDEDDEEEISGGDVNVVEKRLVRKGRRLVRKLKDDFDQVAGDEARETEGDSGFGKVKMSPMLDVGDENGGGSVAVRTRSHGSDGRDEAADEGRIVNLRRKTGSEVNAAKGPVSSPNGPRSSPRLMMRKKEMK